MGKSIEPNGDFITSWLEAREEEAELDITILEIIRSSLTGATPQKLEETYLLDRLIDHSDNVGTGDS